MNNRILIYSINNQINDNIFYFLNQISKYVKKIVIVSLMNIDDEIIKNFNIETANSVVDAINNNKNFDEYIIANDMFYGPFYNLNQLFRQMKDFSIWSIDETFYKYKSFVVFKKTKENEELHYVYKNPWNFNNNIIDNKMPFLHKVYLTKFKHKFVYMKLKNCLSYIKRNCKYDTDIIFNDLLESQNFEAINNIFSTNIVVSTKHQVSYKKIKKKIAVIMYIFQEKLEKYCYKYALKIPKGIDLYIITTSETTLNSIKKDFDTLSNTVKYRVQKNRGRDNTALLTTCCDLMEQYNYICFVHSKDSPQNIITGSDFRDHCFKSLLYNSKYINNVINTFEKNPKLGILIPAPPEFEPYECIGNEWLKNYDNAKNFLKDRLNKEIHIDKNNIVCTFGNMFWFRPQALKTLLSMKITFNDFPKEPIKETDGLLTHAIERFIPTLALSDGYYSSYIISDIDASSYIDILMKSLKNNKKITQ